MTPLARLAAFELVISPTIADEVLGTLGRAKLRRYFRPDIVPAEWFAGVAKLAFDIPGDLRISRLCRDPDDDKYVAAAVESGAEYVVTGDADLLAIGSYDRVAIIRPRAFLAILDREPV